MCLAIYNNQVEVAEEDITCYKFLRLSSQCGIPGETLTSPYQSFEYELGKEYSSNLQVHTFEYDDDEEDEDGCERFVEEGFHAIVCEKLAHGIVNARNKSNVRWNRPHSYVVVECVIPKGASYYKGTWFSTTGYASNRLKAVAVLKDNKEK